MSAHTSQRLGDAVIGFALSALGAWGTWVAQGTGLGTAEEPGPGMYPAAVCVLLTLGGLGCAWRALRLTTGNEGKRWIDGTAMLALVLIVMLAVLFVPLGMPLAGFLFVCGMTRTLGDIPWRKAVITGAVSVAVLWLLFDVLLSVQLPYGWWASR